MDFTEEVVWEISWWCWLVAPRWRYSVNKLGEQTEAQETGAGHMAGHVVLYLVVMVEAVLLNFGHFAKFSGKF